MRDTTIDIGKLMDQARAGDHEAFSIVYEQYATPIYRYLYFRVSRKEDVEDLLQIVFLKAYKALSRFRNQGKPPLSFFYTIARNAVIDYRRKKREVLFDQEEHLEERIADTEHDVVDSISLHADRLRIQEALLRLSDDQSEVLTLKYINDCSNSEIGQLLGKTEENIRQIQSRGLKALRNELRR